jgi:vacuolar-type H+-ATPase subunit E/Vma4
MGCKELIESLRAAGNGKIRTLRAEAEQDAARVRAGAEARIEALRADRGRERSAAADEHTGRVLAESGAEARRMRLLSERALAERLYTLARGALPALRNVGYADVFASYVRELPAFSWRTVRVNPEDVALARKHFPGAEVVADPGITGGFVAMSAGDEAQVVNTLEQRLAALWDEMLPDMMKDAAETAQ